MSQLRIWHSSKIQYIHLYVNGSKIQMFRSESEWNENKKDCMLKSSATFEWIVLSTYYYISLWIGLINWTLVPQCLIRFCCLSVLSSLLVRKTDLCPAFIHDTSHITRSWFHLSVSPPLFLFDKQINSHGELLKTPNKNSSQHLMNGTLHL